jgi:hypothetical protein
MIAWCMAVMHQPYSEVMRMPVETIFDLMAAHAQNNEVCR